MFTPINYDFSANKSLSDYGLEESQAYPFKSAKFEGGLLKLIASTVVGGELLIKTDASSSDVNLKLKVKNAKGHAISGVNKLVSNEYVKTSTVANGMLVIFVGHGEAFEFNGYSVIAD